MAETAIKVELIEDSTGGTERSACFQNLNREGHEAAQRKAYEINRVRATSCLDGHFAFCCAIHLLVRASSRSRGSVPPSSISSWNLRRSNFGPNSFWARSRSSRNFNCPSL